MFQGLERTPNSRTLTQFILPLVSQFICSEKYASKNSLIDAAVRVSAGNVFVLFCFTLS